MTMLTAHCRHCNAATIPLHDNRCGFCERPIPTAKSKPVAPVVIERGCFVVAALELPLCATHLFHNRTEMRS